MSARLLVPLVTLLVGGGVGFAACWFARPTPAAVPAPEPSPDGDEVVVELRVKLPPGKVPPIVGPDHTGSSARQGALLYSGDPFHLAIDGAGFFQVQLPNGDIAYTRNGTFGLSPQGIFFTREGYMLLPQIGIPADAISVSVGADGTVSMTNVTGHSSTLGQLTLVTFLNPGWLDRDEHGLCRETTGSGCPHDRTPGVNGSGLIRQGFRERQSDLDANMLVDLVRAVVREDGRATVRVER